jgi:hypothetical protein
MFDNEIDWVTCSGVRFHRREAPGEANDSEHVKYKAEHMQMSNRKLIVQASVQVRRVSLGVVVTVRVSAQDHAQRRRIGYLPTGPK